MDWIWFLFGFEGRINRARFFLAGLVLLCWMFLLVFLFACASALLGGPTTFHIGVDEIFALFDPATWPALTHASLATVLVHAVGTPLFLWVFLAASVKRLHDRDRSGWWMIPFFLVPGLYKQFSDRLPDSSSMFLVGIGVLVFIVWGFIEMYCLRGTSSANRFGPDPLAEEPAPPQPGRKWDQASEIEIAPHIGSPPPGMHVKPGT
jgi:uncharacterized membrane protein YhaH (DUF805 family)